MFWRRGYRYEAIWRWGINYKICSRQTTSDRCYSEDGKDRLLHLLGFPRKMVPAEETEITRRKISGAGRELNTNQDTDDIPSKSQVDNDTRNKKLLNRYITAIRPWSFSASFTPVILGTVVAWKETSQLNILSAVLAGISILAVHGAGNLVNTYYDYLLGIDNKQSDDKTLVDEILKPDDVVKFGVAIYIIGCLSFLGTILTSHARIDHLGLLFFAGMSGSFLYTGSIGLKYHALGDIVIVLTFGPISVLYSYLVQCHHLSVVPLLYGIPLVMNTEAILHGNNTRDIKCDLQANVLTLAIILGFKLSYLLYCVLIFVPYLLMLVFAIKISYFFLMPTLTIKMALNLEKDFRFKRLTSIAQNTAKLNLLFGLLYVMAFIMK